MDSRVSSEVSIADLFDQFVEASTMRDVLSLHHRILNYSDISPSEFNLFYPKLKKAVLSNRVRKSWKAKALFSKIDKKSAHRCYSNTKAPTPIGNRPGDVNSSFTIPSISHDDSLSSQTTRTPNCNNALQGYNCLVIGSGPAGLRTAIELQMLGANRVIVVEKRSRFSRNNVLHLWPFVIDDLKSLGAKKFYGKFCAGSIDHISIRQLQLILLKISLMVGCDFRDSCSYSDLCPDSLIYNLSGDIEPFINHSDIVNSLKGVTSRPCCEYEPKKSLLSKEFVKVTDQVFGSGEVPSQSTTEGEIQSGTTLSDDQFESTSKENREVLEEPTSIGGGDCKKIQQIFDKDSGRNGYLRGTRAHFKSDYPLQEEELHNIEWDIIIGADGRRNTLSRFFPRKEFRGRLAIAITANFINRQTPVEAAVPEISGLSFIYNQDMFNSLAYDTRIELENICYYKDDTHYFVMTAKKRSLLERGVLIRDYATTQDLLSEANVDKQALLKYAKDAAYWTTGLEPLDFALNHYGQEDCAMFDFTSMYAASNACKALKTRSGGLSLISLVGDSLLEPFWPTGSGCARGFLSSFDAAWMCRQWAVNRCATVDHYGSGSMRDLKSKSPNGAPIVRSDRPATHDRMALSVIAERESIYRILAQTTSENLHQNYSHWTLNPHSRYPNLNRHLITSSQVEHLITDGEGNSCVPISSNGLVKNRLRLPKSDKQRRSKSPQNTSTSNSRKSPKKLKSASASPSLHAKSLNRNQRAKSLANHMDNKYSDKYLFDDIDQELEMSYFHLNDKRSISNSDYLDHRPRAKSEFYDESFRPSISGTLPSSNNLLNLEANRARDIDECLRQRRQKTQLKVVRDSFDQMIGQMRGGSVARDTRATKEINTEASSLFHELRRIREQAARGRENLKARDINGLTLYNSMRRSSSFAERVRNFENNKSSTNPPTPLVDTKPHIDSVKNLPHFETLQGLFVGNARGDKPKKSRIPTRLSKDDWNVKCWEDRLMNYRQKTEKELLGSSKSLNKSLSVDSYQQITKPTAKQAAVFKDRIKQMANKLETPRDHRSQTCQPQRSLSKEASIDDDSGNAYLRSNARSKGWVSQLRREFTRGTSAASAPKQAMNPSLPSKPIKKLFEDDDEDDDGIDINKHYDHLCVNRPTNRYLSKSNGYTSHLVRSRYNTSTAHVINRPKPTSEAKQAYMANLSSRGSSVSSTLSDSSNGSSIIGASRHINLRPLTCIRCKKSIASLADKICIGEFHLHRTCLSCSGCGITLRSDEIQIYLSQEQITSTPEAQRFNCSICEPRKDDHRVIGSNDNEKQTFVGRDMNSQIRSREDFLTQKINYNELYRNLLVEKSESVNISTGTANIIGHDEIDSSKKRHNKNQSDGKHSAQTTFSEQITIESEPSFRVVESEINKEGNEQVTIILPASEDAYEDGKVGAEIGLSTWRSVLMDEDELERIHNPNRLQATMDNSLSLQKVSDEENNSTSDTTSSSDDGQKRSNEESILSEDLSGIDSDDNDSADNTDIEDSDSNQSETHNVRQPPVDVDHKSTSDGLFTSEDPNTEIEKNDDCHYSNERDEVSKTMQLTKII